MRVLRVLRVGEADGVTPVVLVVEWRVVTTLSTGAEHKLVVDDEAAARQFAGVLAEGDGGRRRNVRLERREVTEWEEVGL